jgi:hypothetical protein
VDGGQFVDVFYFVLDDGFEFVDYFLQLFSAVDVVVVDVQHRVVQFLSHYY